MRAILHITCLTLALAGLALTASAQAMKDPMAGKVVDVIERLGDTVPLDVEVVTEEGERVTLADLMDDRRPVLLALVYYSCPSLCSEVMEGVKAAAEASAWRPGQDGYQVLTVSVDPRDTPASAREARTKYLAGMTPEEGKGWHFLTADSSEVARLAEATGFTYVWLAEIEQYAHPAVITFLSGEGKITRYLYGVRYPALDYRLALAEAAEGKVGTTLDRVLLTCYTYDPNEGSYVLFAKNFMKAGGVLIVLILGSFLLYWWRREGRNKPDWEASLK